MDKKIYYVKLELRDDELEKLEKLGTEGIKLSFAANLMDAIIKEQMAIEELKQKISDRIGAKIGGMVIWEYRPPERYVIRWRGAIEGIKHGLEFSIPYEELLQAFNPLEVVVDSFIRAYENSILKKEKDV